VIDYQLRQSFSFFGAKTLATGVFIADRTVMGDWLDDPQCSARLDQLVAEAVCELTSARATEASERAPR
jgi:NAD(P)H-dependent FMN reductase